MATCADYARGFCDRLTELGIAETHVERFTKEVGAVQRERKAFRSVIDL